MLMKVYKKFIIITQATYGIPRTALPTRLKMFSTALTPMILPNEHSAIIDATPVNIPNITEIQRFGRFE